MKKLIILFLFAWNVCFGQVPNRATFTIGHVMKAVYGDSTSGRNTSTVFADSDAAKFDAVYGSKTMSPQTINGFRNYGAVTAPTVITTAISAITETTATSGGNVTSDGGATVTDRGVCWGTSTNPTTANSHTHNYSGMGSYSSSITGLTINVTYYVRAYATNSAGTSYGGNESFIYSPGYGKLYNGFAVEDSRNISASGWHVPTVTEWNTLVSNVGGSTYGGGALKETGLAYWESPNVGASNAYSFNAKGSGIRTYSSGTFTYLRQRWEIYSSTPYGSVNLQGLNVYSSHAGTGVTPLDKKNGAAVRFIKDDSTLATYTGNDGQTYTTVKIGNQVWMSQNLRETKYRDGSDIPQVTDNTSWYGLTTGAWCWYGNNSGYE